MEYWNDGELEGGIMADLNLAVVQFTPQFGKKDENLNRMAALVADIEADIIVYPELCTSGYFFQSHDELEDLAEIATGPSFRFLQQLADRIDAVIAAGFAERDGSAFYNSCMLVLPGEEEPIVYRKTHLFYRETIFFEPGNTGFLVVPVPSRNVTLGPMVCYDWRFPESARVLTLLGADIIVCPANLVTDAWKVVMPARAVENNVYLAVANRAGQEVRGGEKLVFKGSSAIYDLNGQAIKSAGLAEDEVLLTAVDPEKARDKSTNSINHSILDRKPHHYSPITAS